MHEKVDVCINIVHIRNLNASLVLVTVVTFQTIVHVLTSPLVVYSATYRKIPLGVQKPPFTTPYQLAPADEDKPASYVANLLMSI